MNRRLLTAVAAALVVASSTASAASGATKVYDRVDEHGHFVGTDVPADPDGGEATLQAFRPTQLRGGRKVAVIPMQFGAGGPQATWTTAGLKQTVFTATASVDAFVRESSDGRLWLTGRDAADGDVYPTVTIGGDWTVCDEERWGDAAIAALQGQGHLISGNGLDGYHHYVFVFPRVTACGWAGLGMMPGRETWINGAVDRQVIAHELGHNFGLAHANTLRCFPPGGGPAIVVSDTCTSGEYGDPFESMGVYGKQFSGAARALLGEFDGQEAVRVTGSTTVTLESVSAPGAGIRSIEIPRPGTTQSWYLETRSTAGQFDNFTPGDHVLQGVLIRRHDTASFFAAPTELVDAHPATSTFSDAAFTPGETFVDPAGLSVAVVARTATAATVTITFGAPPSSGTSGSQATPTNTAPVPSGVEPGAATPPRVAANTLTFTTDPAVAKRWPSRIVLQRRADGRVVVMARLVGSTGRCSYRVRALTMQSGACSRLAAGDGWRVVRTVRAGQFLTVTLVTPNRTPVTRRVRVPARAGTVRAYRI